MSTFPSPYLAFHGVDELEGDLPSPWLEDKTEDLSFSAASSFAPEYSRNAQKLPTTGSRFLLSGDDHYLELAHGAVHARDPISMIYGVCTCGRETAYGTAAEILDEIKGHALDEHCTSTASATAVAS